MSSPPIKQNGTPYEDAPFMSVVQKDSSDSFEKSNGKKSLFESLPYALGCEKAVLSVLLQYPHRMIESHGLTASSFYLPAHQTLFSVFNDIVSKGNPDDLELVLLHQRLLDIGKLDHIGGIAALGELISYAPNENHFETHVSEVHDKRAQALLVLAGIAAQDNDVTLHDTLMAERESVLNISSGSCKFESVHMDELEDVEGSFDFVESLLSDGCASVVYGSSNSGKTFFVLDLAAHVAMGTPWQDRECEQGAVLYIALEGRQGAKNRIEAMKHRGILSKGAPLYVCSSQVNLLDPAHGGEVVKMIKSINAVSPCPVRLVIVDTLARAIAGGDENSGKDMGEAVRTIDSIRSVTTAHILIVHHSGKDASRGGRGHSSLRAAVDTEIEVTHPSGDIYRVATIVKQRDLATISPLCFSLDVVELGLDRRGKAITSCVVKAQDEIMIPSKSKGGAPIKFTPDMVLELLPQPSIGAWRAAAKIAHGMGRDGFDACKMKCSSQWIKDKNAGNLIKLEVPSNIVNAGMLGNCG